MSHAAHRSRRRPVLWWWLAAGLSLAAVVCLVMWGARTDPRSAVAATPAPAPASPTFPAAGASTAVVTDPLALPVSLRIPSIDVATHLIRLGLQDDGSVEVPEDAALAGWFREGPPPGSAGSSVILGHVDSLDGPAVFYRLRELAPGDRIAVKLDDGSQVAFRVHSVETYANEDFPAQEVYGKQGRSVLNLVTCGGAYDSANGGYQSNVVVNARLV